MKTCAAASEYIFCFLKNVRLLLKDINERLLLNEKYAAASEYIFFCVEDCVAASRKTSMFFNERAAASKRYQ